MADYTKQLINDLPDQFKGKARIEALLGVIGKQLDAVANFYDDLSTQRTLSTAVGVQLDMLGDIIGLTRKEAYAILDGVVDTLDDETYRTTLLYKIVMNNGECTYYDLINAMKLILNGEIISYREELERPATIILDVSESAIEENTVVNKLTQFKPAGVSLYWNRTIGNNFEYALCFGISESQFSVTELPLRN